jgi:glycosyltransferase involved in cell wall biosynthesis
VWEEVLALGANCNLVLAGLHVKSSSSRESETLLLSQHTNLRGQAHGVGHVTAQSREWLLANAAVALYPSSAEGFGFIPYEAAALGTPSTFANFGPLEEIAEANDVPRNWSIDAFAADVAALLTDPVRAEARVGHLRRTIKTYTWGRFADQLVEFMERIEQLPPAEGALVGGTAADAAALAAVLGSKTWRSAQALRKITRLGR